MQSLSVSVVRFGAVLLCPRGWQPADRHSNSQHNTPQHTANKQYRATRTARETYTNGTSHLYILYSLMSMAPATCRLLRSLLLVLVAGLFAPYTVDAATPQVRQQPTRSHVYHLLCVCVLFPPSFSSSVLSFCPRALCA